MNVVTMNGHGVNYIPWREFLREARVTWWYALRLGDEISTCLYSAEFCYFSEKDKYLHRS